MKNIDEQYKESLDFLYSQLPMFSRVGAAAYKPGLETSISLDEYFGHPHREFKSIHVGGTNGKGSTSHMLASVLASEGYKTGLCTSPHLVDFRERIRINGEKIPKMAVTDFVNRWRESGYEGRPSFFELTMMMAFEWFAKERVDYAVIEVGMGGRLDSTNIITPELCVITNISHDHNQFLGNSLPEIAAEKAGIIKNGIPVVIGEKDPESSPVFSRKAEEVGAPIVFAEDTIDLAEIIPDISGGWQYESPYGRLRLPLGGDYQQKNLLTVLTAIEELKKRGVRLSDRSIIEGIANVCRNTGFAGRWSIIHEKPLVIADTGHNIGGLTYNFRQLERLQVERNSGKLRIVIGFVADKSIDKILGIMPKEAEYYATNANLPRALPAHDLAQRMKNEGFKVREIAGVAEACKTAFGEAAKEDIIYIGGSTFVVGECPFESFKAPAS